jgi:uncharacterized phage-like protein YoqJ
VLRVHAAHALALARSELAVRAHEEAWNDEDRSWLCRLIDQAGYVPTAWERDRLRDTTDPERLAAVGAPDGIGR